VGRLRERVGGKEFAPLSNPRREPGGLENRRPQPWGGQPQGFGFSWPQRKATKAWGVRPNRLREWEELNRGLGKRQSIKAGGKAQTFPEELDTLSPWKRISQAKGTLRPGLELRVGDWW